MTTLNIDKSNLTIMGGQFDSQKEFKGVWYALSTNMIEGWEPEKQDVEEMKQYSFKRIKRKCMSKLDLYEEYYYDEPDNEYTSQDSSVLRNKFNMREFEELVKQEYQLVGTQALDLNISPSLVHSMKDVCKIHFMLFLKLYEWAGNYRKVNISKQGNAFMVMQSFATSEQYMDLLFNDYTHDADQISVKLAVILDNLNYMHPYRETNGRTQREVVRVLAITKGYELLINVDGEGEVCKQFMDGTVYSDVKVLDQLISSLLEKAPLCIAC